MPGSERGGAVLIGHQPYLEHRRLRVKLKPKYEMRYAEIISEKAPPGKKAKRFIKKAKPDFKKRYGDAW